MTTKPCRRVRPISAGSGAHQRARLELTEEGSSGEDSAPGQVDWQAVRSPSSPRTGCWTTAAVVTASALEASRRAARRAPCLRSAGSTPACASPSSTGPTPRGPTRCTAGPWRSRAGTPTPCSRSSASATCGARSSSLPTAGSAPGAKSAPTPPSPSPCSTGSCIAASWSKRGFKLKSEALAYGVRQESAKLDGLYVDPRAGKVTFGALRRSVGPGGSAPAVYGPFRRGWTSLPRPPSARSATSCLRATERGAGSGEALEPDAGAGHREKRAVTHYGRLSERRR
jgi:hypothetical protein